MPIRHALIALLFSLPAFSDCNAGEKIHKFKGVIEGTELTFTGSVSLDIVRLSNSHPPKVNILTSWGAVCIGYFLGSSELHDGPFGAIACSDGSVGKFTWGTACAEYFLGGHGTIETREILGKTSTLKFRFNEDWPSSCSCCSKPK
jgi:hypothetical protein